MDDARAVILRLQAQADHSEEEVRAQLESRGFSALQINDALAWGRLYAALDDARAEAATVRQELQKQRGPLRVQARLQARGLNPEVFQEDSASERLRATNALTAKKRKFAGNARKAAAWLARQGYREDTVVHVVEALIGPLHPLA